MEDSRPALKVIVQRPYLVWCGDPRLAQQAELGKVFDVRTVWGLHGAVSAIEAREPAAVVCFLDTCSQPPDFVNLMLTRWIPESLLIYVWPSDDPGYAFFSKRTGTSVLPASAAETRLVAAVREVTDARLAQYPLVRARPAGCL